MAERSQLVTVDNLSVFLSNIRTETDEKIAAAGQGVTYELGKNAAGEIVLTGSDESETKVSDANTTYAFTQNGTTLTITGSDGSTKRITMGEEITSAKIIAALGFTPMDSATEIPDELADLTDDATHRLVTDTEKATWNGKANAATTLAGYGITDAVGTASKNVANGYAGLDENGIIPSAILPGFVDDVEEYANKASFPATGESGKIYIDIATNITYRWGGTEYVAIGSDLALGETSSTAYAGDKGKAVTDAFNTHKADTNIHVTSAERSAWNAKGSYSKPEGGIPASDLASGVIPTSLPASDVTDTYSATGKVPVSGTAVASALTGYVKQVIASSEPSGQSAGDHWLKEY